ncbi:SGNH hydrolase-type esterase domain-containing protein [Stachybotrys elegans]|uniref:SGNH hydrolase-type esterase domain-containing protein n=1 Tax=Stachybotrys elegans TaxID=80388 RepID=A0A8K0WS97_9HYPO|nr:SGNH hydrolase-type esterase domain-containing protein [Stachybotrys elegans]
MGLNLAKNGRTTKSFVEQGWWEQALDAVKGNKSLHQPIVTIQFGHNDQKPANGVPLADFERNLGNMVDEVQAAGGTPVLITPLTRRSFKDGKVDESLVNERATTIKVAEEKGVACLDLNKASVDYVNAIGEANGHKYDAEPGDSTHLNAAGTTVFSRMVADLLVRERSDLGQWIRGNKALSAKIWAGEFATGEE